MRIPASFDLPKFPWDTLTEITALAKAHPEGALDLTIGSPADSVADEVQSALAKSANAHGYPPAVGGEELREHIAEFMRETRGAQGVGVDEIILTIGSKELVASLAFQLGLGAGDVVGFPEVAYPTYEVGAILAGARALRLPENPRLWSVGDQAPKLVWLNSPGNPNGHTYSVGELREAVVWARENAAILVADECYALLDWQGAPQGSASGTPSLLDREVTGGNLEGLLVTHSLSKQNNLAGYRAAWICGDPELVAGLREVRKHWGLMVPGPIQAAMRVALADRETPRVQKEIYRLRREKLLAACARAGLESDPRSVAGLYLWVKSGEVGSPLSPGRGLAKWFAQRGIRVAPGDFYGPAGSPYVRISLTATDADIDRACARL